MNCKQFVKLVLFKFRLSLYSICIIGSGFQVYEVVKLYLEYQTTIEVKLRRPTTFELPVLSVCFDLKSLIRDDWLLSHNVESNSSRLDEILGNMTVAEKAQATLTRNETFKDCHVLEPNSRDNKFRYLECFTINEPVVKLVKNMKCFVYFTAIHNGKKVNLIDSSLALNTILIKLQLRKVLCDSAIVYIDAKDQDILTNDEGNWLGLDLCYFNSYIISFSKIKRTLLKYPYETNCVNYSQSDTGLYTTRAGCIRACLVRNANQQNYWPSQVPAPDNINLRTEYEVEKPCHDECGSDEDCSTVTYNLKEDYKRHRTKGDLRTKITFEVQKGLEETYIHNPKLDLIEFVCYIGSAVSLWFGMSVLTFSNSRWMIRVRNAFNINGLLDGD